MHTFPKLRKSQKYKSLHQSPGKATYVGEKEGESSVEVISYSKKGHERIEGENLAEAYRFRETGEIAWINVDGLNNVLEIEKLGREFGLHPLVTEDIVNTEQRPKIEEHENYIFVALKMLYYDKEGNFVREHLSVVLGNNHVLTFQEANEDVFDGLRERISHGKGRIRGEGADYLMYSVLDAVIDNYFTVVESISEKIQSLEEELFKKHPGQNLAEEIQRFKREILKIRKAVLPLRETIKQLENSKHPFINPKTKHYLGDLYDHIVQVGESVELYREMAWGLMDMYMTNISNKMNEVMKVLTIMASIFIPLTFIAGIYGMNFEYMPELDEPYGYFVVWGVMIAIFIGMLVYFKKKDWL